MILNKCTRKLTYGINLAPKSYRNCTKHCDG
uniref:Uncharacterized protein n=1 Tax=Arundo donax TaxID=35708 RepID=A0A0A8Z192_ARUDO